MTDYLIDAWELRKSFGETRAVDGVSLSVAAGEIYGLVGPDGAGKTTVMRLLCGALTLDDGDVEIGGYDIRRQVELAQEPEELVFLGQGGFRLGRDHRWRLKVCSRVNASHIPLRRGRTKWPQVRISAHVTPAQRDKRREAGCWRDCVRAEAGCLGPALVPTLSRTSQGVGKGPRTASAGGACDRCRQAAARAPSRRVRTTGSPPFG